MNSKEYARKLDEEAGELEMRLHALRMQAPHEVDYSYGNTYVMRCADEKLNRISRKAAHRSYRRRIAYYMA